MKQEKNYTKSEMELIKKYESNKKKTPFKDKKEMYLKQTDRNYKDGDRN
jgi:hypothetical protein